MEDYTYKISPNFHIRAWMPGDNPKTDKPWLYQPQSPEGGDWGSFEEASSWVEGIIAMAKNPSLAQEPEVTEE